MERSLHCYRSVDIETIRITACVRYFIVLYYIFSALFGIYVYLSAFLCYFDQMEEILTAEDDKIEEEQGAQHELVTSRDEGDSTKGSQFQNPSEAFSDEYQLFLTDCY